MYCACGIIATLFRRFIADLGNRDGVHGPRTAELRDRPAPIGRAFLEHWTGMIRSIAVRLAALPLILLLINAAAYCFAVLAQYRRAVSLVPPGEPLPPPPGLVTAYAGYAGGLVRGNLGVLPYAAGTDTVASLVFPATLASLGLLGIALLLSVAAGMLLGLGAVRRDPPGVALWLTSFATVGLATPAFYLGSLLIAGALLYVIYGPGAGTSLPIPIQGFGWDTHLILPLLVLMLLPTARIAQMSASLLAGELSKPYVIATRSFGFPWNTVVRRYALRNVLAPVIAVIAGSLRLMAGELIVVERIFGWPGLGQLVALTLAPPRVLQAATAPLFLHPPTIAAVLTLFATVFVLADLAATLLSRAIDPRLR